MKETKRKFDQRAWAKLEADLIQSEAFCALSTANSVRVLIRFLQKRRFAKKRKNRKNIYGPEVTNQGQIIFTYQEASELGIKGKGTFQKCLKELVRLGFIDIEEEDQDGFRPGFGRMPTKFRISSRWKLYGTAMFQVKEKKRVLPPGVGFKKGNKEWQLSRRSSKNNAESST